MRERLSVEHLDGPRKGQVDPVEKLPATLGSAAGQDVVVPGAAPHHARIERQNDDVVLVHDGDGQPLLLAGHTVRSAVLRDGDIVSVGKGGPRLMIRRRLLQLAVPRMRSRRHAFHIVLAVLLAAGAGVLVWSYRLNKQVARLQEALHRVERDRRRFEDRVEAERRKTETDRLSLESRIDASHRREEELNKRLAEAAGGSEVAALRRELQKTRTRLVSLEGERAVGEKIIRDYGSGVCLIHGAYAFYDDAAKPLRYQLDKNGEAVHEADGSLALEVGSTGSVYTVDYFGTGFLIDRRGIVLTNRHVAQPWWKDDTAQSLAKQGYHAKFVTFRAFFPGMADAFKLDVHRLSGDVDLALLKVDLRGRKVPVLPLDASGSGAVPGQAVVVVGYPTGLEALLAKADSSVVQEILAAHGTASGRITEALAKKGLIRPSTTQGHIGDVTKSDIVFDAPTSQGGSGGPVFGRSGQVIAVEYAVLSKFGGNSFGLPITHVLELLKEPTT